MHKDNNKATTGFKLNPFSWQEILYFPLAGLQSHKKCECPNISEPTGVSMKSNSLFLRTKSSFLFHFITGILQFLWPMHLWFRCWLLISLDDNSVSTPLPVCTNRRDQSVPTWTCCCYPTLCRTVPLTFTRKCGRHTNPQWTCMGRACAHSYLDVDTLVCRRQSGNAA